MNRDKGQEILAKETKNIQIHPNAGDIKKVIENYRADKKIAAQERALTKLFTETYPRNSDESEIIIKVSALNTLYSTQLRKYLFAVVSHIKNLDIDDRLLAGDITLIDDIIQTPVDNGKVYRCYSFTTKYCSFHRPDIYPIYDSYVNKVLVYLQKRDSFAEDMVIDNKNYASYVEAIRRFKEYYNLQQFSLKEVDKYLWKLGYELVKGN